MGFLGSILCPRLIEKGYTVRILDSLFYPSKITKNPNLQFVKADIRNLVDVARSLKDIDTVIHLAGIVGKDAITIDPKTSIEINYLATKNLAELCHNRKITNLIFASTCSIYGSQKGKLVTEKTTPQTHLIKLGTLGEYGTPEIEIPEGFLEIEQVRLPFPKQANSFYHLTKVHDSNNIMFASKIWGLTSTDIMQGIVYGTKTKELQEYNLNTRFDIDEAFGTVINRFCAQAVIGYPLTVYGKGGQTRGLLSLSDSIQCIELLMNNPPEKGEYRVVNQFDEKYSVLELARMVKRIGDKKGLDVEIKHIKNPRMEKEEHQYKVNHDTLLKLGFKHTRMIDDEISIMLDDLIKHKKRILEKKDLILKGIKWRS